MSSYPGYHTDVDEETPKYVWQDEPQWDDLPRWNVGDLVYSYGYPQNPGVIREVVCYICNGPDYMGGILLSFRCTVEWLKETKKRPKVTKEGDLHVRSFSMLLADHRKKLKTHTATMHKLERMRDA